MKPEPRPAPKQHLPAVLAAAGMRPPAHDPFAAPRETRPGPTPNPAAAALPTARRGPQAGPAGNAPCRCRCGCTNTTDVPLRIAVESVTLHARCDACFQAGHPVPVARPPAPGRADKHPPKIRPYRPSAAEQALDRAVALDEENLRWDERTLSWRESVNELFRDAVTEDPVVLDRLERIRSKQRGGLLVLGEFGRGKSWRVFSLANMAVRDRLLMPSQIVHGSESELFGPVAVASFGQQEHLLSRMLDKRTRMVLIDDLGRCYYPGGEDLQKTTRHGLFERVFDAAWSDEKYLVVSSNLLLPEIVEYIGAAAYERLADSVGDRPLWVNLDDKRRQLRGQREAEWARLVSVARRGRGLPGDPFQQ